MKNRSKINSLVCVAISAFAIISGGSAFAQISKEAMDVISIPDKVETVIGQLEFFDGVPNDATIDKLYDNLDRMRGVEVYLSHSGAGSLNAMRKGNASIGADSSNKVTITEQLLKPASLYLTGNTSTLYALTYLDLKTEGPLVVELPPGMLGFLDDAWFRFVENLGVIGPDKGQGGKYLLLPPSYSGAEPEGYFIVKLPTYNNLMFLRGSIAKGLEPAVENIKSKLKIYPLAKEDNPPATEFFNFSGKSYSTIVARDFTYQPRIDGVFIYPETDSSWTTAYANKNTSFEADGTTNLDARPLFYFNATGVTPAMATSHAGAGSDYALAYLDADKKAFDGSKTYKLHLPPNVPVNDFWAVTLYDTQTRSLLQTSQTFPTVGSQSEGFQKNDDGSYDVYFGPKPPDGNESNWRETIPGKSWFCILRMYGPLEPWIDKTWRPGEIKPLK